jgi:hypothetical protein
MKDLSDIRHNAAILNEGIRDMIPTRPYSQITFQLKEGFNTRPPDD